MGDVNNIKIKPVTVYMGEDKPQVQTITCVADVASSLNNKYFLFHDSADAKHYAWFNVGSAGADPTPAGGWTAHEVAISVGATASAVASALAAVLAAITGFDSTSSSAVATLTHTENGYAQPARDADSEANQTGFAFEVTTFGDLETDVGYTDGDISLSGLSKTKEAITAHQTGKVELGDIITGYAKPELGITFKETDKDSLKRYLIAAGSTSYTREGVGKTEVIGYGPENVGKPTPTKRVRLHQVSKGAADKSEDFVFWKAAIDIDKFDFSGEKFSTVPSKMSIYPDTTKYGSAQYFIVGDPDNA